MKMICAAGRSLSHLYKTDINGITAMAKGLLAVSILLVGMLVIAHGMFTLPRPFVLRAYGTILP